MCEPAVSFRTFYTSKASKISGKKQVNY